MFLPPAASAALKHWITEHRAQTGRVFQGETIAWGIFEDEFGNLRRQFGVNITGTVEGDTLTLDEHFLYDDGEDNRVWTITNLGTGEDGLIHYEGRAADIDGSAKAGIAGNALNWIYDIDLQMKGTKKLGVRFNDWIYQQDENVAINRAYVSKFGIEIGSVTLVFMRGDAARAISLNLENW